jgi:hypothetical protein
MRYVIIRYDSADAYNKTWNGGLKDWVEKHVNIADFRLIQVEGVEAGVVRYQLSDDRSRQGAAILVSESAATGETKKAAQRFRQSGADWKTAAACVKIDRRGTHWLSLDTGDDRRRD